MFSFYSFLLLLFCLLFTCRKLFFDYVKLMRFFSITVLVLRYISLFFHILFYFPQILMFLSHILKTSRNITKNTNMFLIILPSKSLVYYVEQ